MKVAIVIGIVVVVLAVVVVLTVRALRSRTEKSDWLGELSEIRRSSLDDDEEVTGAIQAVTIVDETPEDGVEPEDGSGAVGEDPVVQDPVVEDAVAESPGPDTSETDAEVEAVSEERATHEGPTGQTEDGAPVDEPVDEPGGEAALITGTPTRTVSDAGTLFNEYEHPHAGRIRVEVTDLAGLRVMVVGGDDDPTTRFAVDFPRGVLWYRGAGDGCSVRIPAGWVSLGGVALVLVPDSGWSYVMCVEGTAVLRPRSAGPATRLTAGQVGRIRSGAEIRDVVEVGVPALETEGVVRRQRRLDGAPVTDA